ncbi:MAG: sulfite exporter TauE/SafE family protein [Planctomycetales bacterium]|nr:sulfite exporter TauE/SafE family protein [Planctomycetales bacterium]
MLPLLGLIALGFAVGAFGTLVGAGGGFLLTPLLLLLYPLESAATITSISLAVAFLNALSGSLAYARMRRIDYRSGALFTAAAIPGAAVGALATRWVPRDYFNGIFGAVLIAAASYLLTRGDSDRRSGSLDERSQTLRTVVDWQGTEFAYRSRPAAGAGLSFAVALLASFLGLGGGIIHVPVLSQVLGFPVQIATATSHFVLAFAAFAGTVAHIATGEFARGVHRTLALGVGALIGAQVGAMLSHRIDPKWILRCLAAALALVGVRMLFSLS